jgi:hypothetical protein
MKQESSWHLLVGEQTRTDPWPSESLANTPKMAPATLRRPSWPPPLLPDSLWQLYYIFVFVCFSYRGFCSISPKWDSYINKFNWITDVPEKQGLLCWLGFGAPPPSSIPAVWPLLPLPTLYPLHQPAIPFCSRTHTPAHQVHSLTLKVPITCLTVPQPRVFTHGSSSPRITSHHLCLSKPSPDTHENVNSSYLRVMRLQIIFISFFPISSICRYRRKSTCYFYNQKNTMKSCFKSLPSCEPPLLHPSWQFSVSCEILSLSALS